ncbi:dystrophin [Platysternon megacephalum]|uniref:Coiled-coil domain-containing protein 172 n=1 Tax=Platysternon megacephalum TaxID=55544 RepID=A0A4D9EVT5_9SAUR|nr:dystrophin [Platysternon megacephalum]
MSLDCLFQQILLTEQQAEEKRRLMHQVKLDINRSHEKIKQITEELNEAKIKLETKVQQLSEKLFYLQLLKKREDILEKKKVEVMNQRSIFLKIFSDTKRKMIEEEENFIKEITDFNNEYGLTCNRELLIRKKAKTEICDLETKANILKNEMESMERENVQLNALQLQKNELKQDLFTLQSKLKDTEEQLHEAEDITKCLEAEKVKVSEKPQTDIECLRIKKELDIYKEDDLENVCEALQTEIEFLQMISVNKDTMTQLSERCTGTTNPMFDLQALTSCRG